MNIDTNFFEIALIAASIIGFIVQTLLLRENFHDFRALGQAVNGRRKIAVFHISTGLGLLYCHGVLLYYGLRLATVIDPPEWPVQLIVNFLLFVGLSVVLVLIGLNDLRVRRSVRQ